MGRPRVSVLIVSRRRPARLRACIASVVAQDFTDREILVLANGCDETAALVRDEHPGVRLVVEPRNLGSAGGRNRITAEARGELLVYLDDDGEIRATDTISRLVSAMDAHPDVGLASMALFDAEDDEPTGWRLRSARLTFACLHASFAGGACIARAAAIHRAGGYSGLFSGSGEEFDLAVRLYAAEAPVLHFPEVAFHHHVDKSERDWMRLLSEGYAHLQLTIWRLYPWPWCALASAKALLAALYVDVRLCGGRLILRDVAFGLRCAIVGVRRRRPVPRAALESLYAAKYLRVVTWEELERVRPGILRRLPLLRWRRKRLGLAKLPPP